MSADENTSQIVLFESSDGDVTLEVTVDSRKGEVWLNKDQIACLFDRDRTVISRHISNIYKEQELEPESTCAKYAQVRTEGVRKVERKSDYYNLDVIISVGYRVKSRRGVEFRRWATDVLRRYIINGQAQNARRLMQLSKAIKVLGRVADDLNASQVLEVVESYAPALDLLDDYDHQRIERPLGSDTIYYLDYDECKELISALRFYGESEVFGVEKDESFKSSIAAIYQSFDGKDVYPSVQEKAANLLYFIVKNHSFHDGNKRIAAMVFLYFLDKNGILYRRNRKLISDSALVATTIMIAESKPEERDIMVSLVMNFLVSDPSDEPPLNAWPDDFVGNGDIGTGPMSHC